MKKMAVFNDISGFGKCSLTAALPIVSALGVQCCPVPTAVLSNQTGYPSYTHIPLTDSLTSYIDEWVKLGFKADSVLTGFLSDTRQADIISQSIDRISRPDTLTSVDPVMADDGIVYSSYSAALCKKVIDLTKKADIITPNLSELCILTDTGYKKLTAEADSDSYYEMIAEKASRLINGRLKTVIVTGVKKDGCIANIINDNHSVTVIKSELFGGSFSGTGDIFACIVTAELTKGMSTAYAVKKASRFIEKAVRDSVRKGTDRNEGINFEKYIEALINE
ncbi:MAG: pyridoxamine kinase [Ruminococcaceae bacterium]|nr:pyridoxamine kinase [Oscillospiraceae bacterium]